MRIHGKGMGRKRLPGVRERRRTGGSNLAECRINGKQLSVTRSDTPAMGQFTLISGSKVSKKGAIKVDTTRGEEVSVAYL